MRGLFFFIAFSTLLPVDRATAEAIGCGESLPRSISSLGEVDHYTFSALAGERVRITTAPASGSLVDPAVTLFGPGNVQVALNGVLSACSGSCGSASFPTTGTYTINALDLGANETGGYNLTLEAISGTFNGSSNGPPSPVCAIGADGTQPLVCGETLQRQFDLAGETDTFTFDAVANDRVRITTARAAGSTVDPLIVLFGPGGAQVALNGSTSSCSGSCNSAPLPSNGTYTVMTIDSGVDETGGYNLTLEATAGAFNGASNGPPTPICGLADDGTALVTCGQPLLETFEVEGDTDTFTFTADASDTVRITTAAVSSTVDPRIVLFAPSGDQVLLNGSSGSCAGSCTSALLPSAGTYTIMTIDSSTDETGAYSLLLEELVGGMPVCNNACNNGVDDDSDGKIDFPADSGCSYADDIREEPECNDGLDNDRDGRTDFAGGDIGCFNSESLLEDPECEDNADNDDDGLFDWDGAGVSDPDPQCKNPYGNRETSPPPPGCGLGPELIVLIPLFAARGRRTRPRQESV